MDRLKADLDFVADAAMKAAEDVAKKQTTVDETMGTVLRIQTGGESKRAEEALGNLRRAVAGYDPAVEDDARAHAEAGHVEDDAEASNKAIVEANAGADAPADVEPLAQTEILQAGLEAGANKAQEAAVTQEEKQRADEEKRRADEEKRRADACLQQTLRVPTADAQN